MTRVTVAALILVLSAACSGAAEAAVCTDENGVPIPCEQDPGGGGEGGWCANPTCYGCGEPEPDGYSPCLPGAGSSCSCDYPNGIPSCTPIGECEYTGP